MGGEHIDKPDEVRIGEEVDLEALRGFLEGNFGEKRQTLEVRQFPSGHSNLTYLVRYGEQEIVLRRPPRGTRPKSGHDMAREFRILSILDEVVDWVPRPIALCDDEDVLGAPFYLMERVQGVILRGSDGGVGELSEEKWRRLSEVCVETLHKIHEVYLNAAALNDLGKPIGYIDRQIDGWTRRWEKAKTEEVAAIEEVVQWLHDNKPEDDPSQTALIHNDFKYDNLVLDPDDLEQVRAVLDWELTTLGDRRMDLGTTLAYWTEPGDDPALLLLALGPTVQPGNLSRQGVLERYEELQGREVSDVLFFYIYGLFKVAVIGQQIYYRYHLGQTKDPRFAGLNEVVKGIGRQAVGSLESGRI